MPQQRLGRHDDQRLAELADHLSAQDVEIVGRGRAVDHLHIVLGAALQVALEAGGGVFRTLALVAVRQQHDEAAHPQPLALARGNELVHNHLGAVGEVAELGFPHGQGVGVGEREAVLEAQHRLFRQRRVQHLEVRLAGAEVA